MSSKSIYAKQFARLLRTIADRLENEPDFFDKLLPSNVKESAGASDFDLFSAMHADGIEVVRQRLDSMELKELKSLVYQHAFDNTGKVRKWKQKERVIEFLLEATSRLARRGDLIFPPSPKQGKSE